MDEPLSNLDALLRLEMRAELKAVLENAGTTTVYVTHDQTEAMGLADRIAVLYAGRIVQIDRPTEIYRNPATRFVGGFVGSPPMNFLTLKVAAGQAKLGALALTPPTALDSVVMGIRGEDLHITDAAEGFPFEVHCDRADGIAHAADGHRGGTTDPRRRTVRHAARAGRDPALAPGAGSDQLDGPSLRGVTWAVGAMTDRSEQARAILRANDRGGYCVPTARLYPFQWNWDSAFVAMGWATFDEARAWDEIASLLKGQWDDGLIPQIVFHAPSDDYFPGPEVWGIAGTPPTSGIAQPPVLATAVARLLAGAHDQAAAEARAVQVYPRLLANHRWWEAARDPAHTGLVATLHPWETGMDNSPAWDAAMARVPTETTTTIRRRDTSHVDPAMRPRAEDYERFIHLVDAFRAVDWRPDRMLAVSPFRMADVGTNAILLRAERDLLTLASRFGTAPEQAEIAARVARLHAAIGQLWHADLGVFTCFDLIDDAPVRIGTSTGFLPLFASAATEIQVAALGATLTHWAARAAWLVPSTDPGDVRFEPLRGPGADQCGR